MKCVAVAVVFACSAFLPCANSLAVATKSPVEQVVKLLLDLKESLVQDAAREDKIYNRYACWCEKATHEKATDIHAAYTLSQQLIQNILKLKAKITVLNNEIADLQEELRNEVKDREDLDKRAAKANKIYQAAKLEDEQTIAATETALKVLRKATEEMHDTGGMKIGEFVQAETRAEQHARNVKAVKAVLASVPFTTRVSSKHINLLSEFARSDYRYAPQSMTIQGILRDMYTTTAKDLMDITSAEADRIRLYEQRVEISDTTIAQLQARIDEKKKLKAEAEVDLATENQKYDNNEEGYHAAIKFFDATKAACKAKHVEYDQRVQLRADELAGVQAAYDILKTDDAREKFQKGMQGGTGIGVFSQTKAATSFLQVQGNEKNEAQATILKAYEAVRALARKSHSYRLAELAMSIRMTKVGHFQKVIEQMDALVVVLKEEAKDDIEKRDECVEKYKVQTDAIADLRWKIKNNKLMIAALGTKKDALTKERDATVDAQQKAVQEKDDITNARDAAHQQYLTAQQDDQNVINLLKAAITELSKFYTDNKIELGPLEANSRQVLLVQNHQPVFKKTIEEGVEADFAPKDSRAQSSKTILSIMQHLIEDTQDEMARGHVAEAKEEKDFQDQRDSLIALIATLDKEIIDLNDAISKVSDKKVAEETTLETNINDLAQEEEYKHRITPDCDWIMGAFKERADKRNAEIRGLQESKEYLVGKLMPEDALIQKGKKDDKLEDNPFGRLSLLAQEGAGIK